MFTIMYFVYNIVYQHWNLISKLKIFLICPLFAIVYQLNRDSSSSTMIKTGYHPHLTAGDMNQDAWRIMREEKERYGGVISFPTISDWIDHRLVM